MNILVTGASGFVGRQLAETLRDNHCVYGLFHDAYPPAATWVPLHGDINDFQRMLDIVVNHEIDQIYHCASRAIVRNCRLDPLDCFRTNVIGTVNILEAARRSERVTGVMCMESDKSYGDGPIPYVENQALQPGGVYEASKACAGHVARAYHANYGVPIFTVRSANIYGPGDLNMSRLFPNTITRILGGQLPQITEGADKFKRELIYIDDFVDYAIRLMEAAPWGEAVNVGTGDIYTVSEIVQSICDHTEVSRETEVWKKPVTLTEIPEQWLDLTKLHGLIGMPCNVVTLQEGVKRTVEWYRNNH